MKLIPLTQGLYAKVDDADYERVFNFGSWHARKVRNTFYAACKKLGVQFYMHSFITGKHVDHADRDGLNNQRENLREATVSQNAANKPKQKGTYTSRFKGVLLVEGRWQARLGLNNKRIYLGTFENENDAARAYNKAATEHFKEFALLNEVPE